MAQYLELLVQRDLFDTSGRPLWATEAGALPFEKPHTLRQFGR